MTGEPLPIPAKMAELIKANHRDGIEPGECMSCPSSCCIRAGFAILENVLQIYDMYGNGQLVREGYEFPRGLSFTDFVFRHFDVIGLPVKRWLRKRELVRFHPRCISEDGHPIAVPASGGYYYGTRAELFGENPWLSRGCVFLSAPIADDEEKRDTPVRHCILHSQQSASRISAKPIDCVFFTCDGQGSYRTPPKQLSDRWYRTLDACFPRSDARFTALLEEDRRRAAKSNAQEESGP